MFSIQDVQESLEAYGLEHRFDAYDVWLHMDEFIAKAGIKKGGGKCGRGWAGIKGSCKRMARGGDRKAIEKQALSQFAEKQRSAKKLKSKGTVFVNRALAGKVPSPIGSPAAEKEKLRAKYGGGATSRIQRLAQKEETRAIVAQGGLKQQKMNALNGPQQFDYVNPSPKPKSRSGSAARPTTTKGAEFLAGPGNIPDSMRKHEGVKAIAQAIDFNGGVIDTGSHDAKTWKSGSLRSGKVRVVKLNKASKENKYGSATVEIDYGGEDGKQRRNVGLPTLADGVRQSQKEKLGDSGPGKVRSIGTPLTSQGSAESTSRTTKEVNKTSYGDRIRAIADKLKTEDQIQIKATSRILGAAAQMSNNHENLIGEVSDLLQKDLDKKRKPIKISRGKKSDKTIADRMANAPVQIANSRSSSEPRRKGRSVD